MEKIKETVKGRIIEAKLTSIEDKIRKYVLREFASNGRPPDAPEIVERLKLPSAGMVNQAIQKLAKADIIVRKGDEIVAAYPFSAIETRYKVIFKDGHQIYALCATDAFGIHFALNEDIDIISRCPECEMEMRIIVKDGRISAYNPAGVIEFVSIRERGGCTAESLCPFINFFCSKEHVEEWREKNPEYRSGEIYSLNEALEHGKAIFGDLLK